MPNWYDLRAAAAGILSRTVTCGVVHCQIAICEQIAGDQIRLSAKPVNRASAKSPCCVAASAGGYPDAAKVLRDVTYTAT